MDIILKNNDDSYFYLFKLLSNKTEVKYSDNINDNINKLIIKKVDNFGYIQDSNILLDDLLKNNKVDKIYIEEDSTKLNSILNKHNIKYKILNKSNYYKEEINKLRSVILLKFILDENKQSIYNLKFLILGDNHLSNIITNLLYKLNASYDLYNYDLNNNISLSKYDVIINTSNNKINPELLFNVKKSLIIYDLEPNNSKLDHHLLSNNYIKYRFISNVSLYLPIAKANILERMCEYDSI